MDERAPGYRRTVASDHRGKLAELLGDLRGSGSFATRRTAPAKGLVIEVRGVGALRLPVTAAQAKSLRLVARPARYGHGEATILDRRVRDTWEIPLWRVRIDKRRWNHTLQPMLDAVGDDLGLAPEAHLRAELHSMLVYEPGQFFAAHQDSEKSDAMIGTLVVMLPSRSVGGDLVVEHGGQSFNYAGSASSLTFVAFYSDTRHEVLPVEGGYRVVLTYNLMFAGEPTMAPGDSGALTADIAALFERHFNSTPEPRWPGDRAVLEPPDRLVILLDHQYTERGLEWSRLKGVDSARAEVIVGAADLAGCELALATAEVHETWECYDDTPGWGGRHRTWDDEFDDPDDAGDDALELGELIDSTVRITPIARSQLTFEPQVSESELVAPASSVGLTPDETEYTGYMGNWGNTMDRWYRRAAIVIWPRERTFVLRAKADPGGALHQILDAVDQDREQTTSMVSTLLRFWPGNVGAGDQQALLPPTLRLGWELDDEQQTTALLEPFGVEAVTPADASMLLALTERHGVEWFDRQVRTWFGQARHGRVVAPDRAGWVATLPDLCAGLRNDEAAGAVSGSAASRSLVEHAWNWLAATVVAATMIPTPSLRTSTLSDLATPLFGVLRAAATAGYPAQVAAVVDWVTARAGETVPMLAGAVAAADARACDVVPAAIEPIARHLVSRHWRRTSPSPGAHPTTGRSAGFGTPTAVRTAPSWRRSSSTPTTGR